MAAGEIPGTGSPRSSSTSARSPIGKNFGMGGQAQIGIDPHAAGAIQFHAEFLRQRIRNDAGGPNDVGAFDSRAVGQL